ncbi:MAG: hypothetical protein Q7J31_09185 [Syntrophales bacterium]|nr:hypothetical protein [Syntrophales bacterium]
MESSGVAGMAWCGRQTVQCWRPVIVMLEENQPARIRQRNRGGLYRESEGFKVPFEGKGQHNPARGKGPYFGHATNERRVMEIAERLSTPKYHQDATEEALL